MKTLFALLLLAFGLAFAQPSVVVSMHPHYDLIRQIAGDAVEVTRILPIGASPHTFDPTPRDVARVAEADLVVLNGGLDEWLLDLVEASGTDAPVLELLTALPFEPVTGEAHDHEGEGEEGGEAHAEGEHEEHEGETHEGEEHAGEHDEGAHDHSGVNPHIWLDPVLMAEAVPLFVDALAQVDPENAETYRTNGEALVADLEALHEELTQMLAPVQGAPFVPFHDAWPYFTRRYGLDQVTVIEPAPGREPSPAYIAEALDAIRESGAKAVFNDVQLPARPAEIVAEQAGVPLYTLDPEGGGTSEEETYAAFMRKNAATIAEALRQ